MPTQHPLLDVTKIDTDIDDIPKADRRSHVSVSRARLKVSIIPSSSGQSTLVR